MMGYVYRDYWGDNKNWIIKNKSVFARQMQIRECICVYWGGRWNKSGGRGVVLEWVGMKLWPTSQLCLAVNFPACMIRPHITAWFFFFWMSTWEVYLFSSFQFHRISPFQSVQSPSDLHSELDETVKLKPDHFLISCLWSSCLIKFDCSFFVLSFLREGIENQAKPFRHENLKLLV